MDTITPESFQSFLKSAPTLEDIQGRKQANYNAYQQQIQNVGDVAVLNREQQLSDIEEKQATLGDDIKSPAWQHDKQAALKRIDYNYQVAQLDPNDKAYENKLKSLNATTQIDKVKNFSETDDYKSAKDEVVKINDQSRTVRVLSEQLTTMRKLLDDGHPEKATEFAKEAMVKTINSLVSPDAVSIGEAFMRYPDLLSAPEMGLLGGGKTLQAVTARLAGMSKEQLEEAKSNVTGTLKKVLLANPEKFYESTVHTFNSAASPINDRFKEISERTSSRHAAQMGAKPIALFSAQTEDPVTASIGSIASKQTSVANPTMTPSGPIYGPIKTYGPTPWTVVK